MSEITLKESRSIVPPEVGEVMIVERKKIKVRRIHTDNRGPLVDFSGKDIIGTCMAYYWWEKENEGI